MGPASSVRSAADFERFQSLGVDQVVLPVMAAKISSLEERAKKAFARVYG